MISQQSQTGVRLTADNEGGRLDEFAYWSKEIEQVTRRLQTSSSKGLATKDAKRKLKEYGKNIPVVKRSKTSFELLLSQFKSPIILIFIAAAVLSYFLEGPHDATIILVIVLLSAGLGFWQERGATNAVQKLLSVLKIKTKVVRDGAEKDMLAEDIVPGDVVLLGAGDSIPGDCFLVESKDLFVNESFLTGESYPVEKDAEGRALPLDTPLSRRTNSLFMGSYVSSGKARAIVVKTGERTEFGRISSRIKSRRAETEFERGVRKFGYFLVELTLILVIANFAINVYLNRSVLDSFLFSLALAIGLTPQLLPAIISINLAHGARKMASKKVIVKRLDSIENLGSMNILCADKTGTLTTGVIEVHSAVDIAGEKDDKVLFYAYLNSVNETGFANPIDQAIVKAGKVSGLDSSSFEKLDEIPYDFTRRRLSVLVRREGKLPSQGKSPDLMHLMITKGAVHNVLQVCSHVEMAGVVSDLNADKTSKILSTFEKMSAKGFRILGLAYRDCDPATDHVTKSDENDSTFLGFLVLWDPVRDDAQQSIASLEQQDVSLKMISGDNVLIARYIGDKVGLSNSHVLTGPELDKMAPDVLEIQVKDTDIFAEIEPQQKERIILALKKSGNVIGYLGDGVNDAPALHAADVGISVDTATDVVKEEADMVLLEKNLKVLADGIREGRRTFVNTLKYIFIATSANFGNMFSVAVASFFLPFLPMLPKQILLNNLLTDVQETTIASDAVDRGTLLRPRRWDMILIRRFMIVFGALSALFDFAMFGLLIFVLQATTEQFRTAWFVESVISAALVVLVVRSTKPLLRSKPSRYLLVATCTVATAAAVIPFTPLGVVFDFMPLSIEYYALIAAIVTLYIIAAELTKTAFFKKRRRF